MPEDAPARTWSATPGGAVIHARHCARCGTIVFPPQEYGCTTCGAHGDVLTAADIPAHGTLVAAVVVHTHATFPVPFTMAELKLDSGHVIRALLTGEGEPRHAARYRGIGLEIGGGQRLAFQLEAAE
ncbi:MAG: hypothetical protein KC495_06505 [Dehalococcoidia bacterium]|nr:hypothetical protein [Dehalococcoidia bacterium]